MCVFMCVGIQYNIVYIQSPRSLRQGLVLTRTFLIKYTFLYATDHYFQTYLFTEQLFTSQTSSHLTQQVFYYNLALRSRILIIGRLYISENIVQRGQPRVAANSKVPHCKYFQTSVCHFCTKNICSHLVIAENFLQRSRNKTVFCQ